MDINHLFSVFRTARRGLSIQKEKIAIASENIANANTTRTDQGRVYQPKALLIANHSRQSFNDVFGNQTMRLETTNAKHFSVADNLIKNGGQSGDINMGPDYKVISEPKYKYEYDPGNPDADKNGMVKYPDVNMVKEMTSMVDANQMYSANISVVQAEKQIIKDSLNI